jgi:recombinational DNA repair ATPase RecF
VTLALRLAAHETVTRARDARPVLLLDDAFSELDPSTSSALIECLPAGQAVLTTAGEVPSGASVSETVRLVDGTIT